MELRQKTSRGAYRPFSPSGLPFLDERVIGGKEVLLFGTCCPFPLLDLLAEEKEFEDFVSSSPLKEILLEMRGGTAFLVGGELPKSILALIQKEKDASSAYGGELLKDGSLVLDLKSPEVGPHYGVNLLLGDRTQSSDPLLSTPKSVLDAFGRGSFRGPASYQILASRWDILPEENGNPFNRQFYLSRNGQVFFYSAEVDESIRKASCHHEVNQTSITYSLNNGIEVSRVFFLSAYGQEDPEAIEIQEVCLTSPIDQDIEITFTGAFGFSNPSCMENDVVYQTVIQEGSVLFDEKGRVTALSPNYYPKYFRDKARFFGLSSGQGSGEEFTFDASRFLGGGDIAHPRGLKRLDNRLVRKGASFFALKKKLSLKAGEPLNLFTYTGYAQIEKEGDLEKKLAHFLSSHPDFASIEAERRKRQADFASYASSFRFQTPDSDFNAMANRNLPFQNLYQTFVSRSFAQTQKGYREIGFREIQDLYASLPYFLANGQKDLSKNLLLSWAKNVHRFGYANHNFYYEGKEPGMCSDDALWLLPALALYVEQSGDAAFLEEEVEMPEGGKRKIKDTLHAILVYSSCISIGKHGLPLLDLADWNDCLKIDRHQALSGPEKEKRYHELIRAGLIQEGDSLPSDLSESVMNAFLLVFGIRRLLSLKGAFGLEERSFLSQTKDRMTKNIREHAWIRGYYARVLVNRKNACTPYVGSLGDRLSKNKELDEGSLFLNSFSWSLLSGVADERQIASMLPLVDAHLRTKVGYRLVSEEDLSLLGSEDSATSHYFPGDRENGGVFKHAGMMFAEALLSSSKNVQDPSLRERMLNDAFFMLENAYPYRSLLNPYTKKGNPRFCTQYANPITGEDVGPMLSGTATWMILCLKEMGGISFASPSSFVVPILPKEWESTSFSFHNGYAQYEVQIKKKKGSYGSSRIRYLFDGKEIPSFSFAEGKPGHHSLRIEME